MALACCVSVYAQQPHAISSPQHFAYEVSLAASARQLAMAWYGGPANVNAIFVARLNADGRGDSIVQITDGARAALEPDLQFVERDWLLAWYEKDAANKHTAHLARVDASGRFLWRHVLGDAKSNARNPVVRIHGQRIAVAWIETPAQGEPSVWSASFRTNGTSIVAPRRIAPATRETWNLNAALDARSFYVVYDGQLGGAKELHLVLVTDSGAEQRQLSVGDGFDSNFPDIAIDGERAAVAWFDSRDGNNEVYLWSGALGELAAPIDTRATRITQTAGDSMGAHVSFSGGELALAWCDNTSGRYEVFAQRQSDGKTTRQLSNGGHAVIPSIRAFRRGFAVAWNRFQSVPNPGRLDTITSSVAEAVPMP